MKWYQVGGVAMMMSGLFPMSLAAYVFWESGFGDWPFIGFFVCMTGILLVRGLQWFYWE